MNTPHKSTFSVYQGQKEKIQEQSATALEVYQLELAVTRQYIKSYQIQKF